MEDLLKVFERVTARLGGLSVQQLLQVCQHLEVDPGDAAQKQNGRLRLARKALMHISADEVMKVRMAG